ncbi:hypothetical protein QR680_016980 [Steinernema hermaphroditum]|uniref:Methyltransferase domain-containing protein n=1 Tax=Steinernema hermaphroditum TaxID=289476 RepID=A0AA39LNF5_9BILA|nr:hypothetical protein QR680_016980 [Steinernema hermaphroditum]
MYECRTTVFLALGSPPAKGNLDMPSVMASRIFVVILLTLGFTMTFRFLSTERIAKEIFRVETTDTVDPKIREIYRRQLDGRKALLAQHGPKSPFHDNLYNVAAPEVFCPGLVRMGHLSDGGKWVCNPQKIPNPCVIYSLGVNNEFSFDKEMFEIARCQIRAFDKDRMQPPTVEFYNSIGATLAAAKITKATNVSAAEYSFRDVVRMHNHSKIDILKIDIEGGEYDVVKQMATTPICQILVELHGTPFRMLSVLRTLSSHGFYLFHHEINGGSLKACEFSLIHESCLRDYGIDVIYGRYLS